MFDSIQPSFMKRMLKDKYFITTLFTIGIPVVIQNVISSSLNMVDVIMIGGLGEVSIAAVGLANQFFFVFVLLLFGTNSGSGIFISQFWGKKDTDSIHKTMGVSLTISLLAALIFSMIAWLIPEQAMSLFSSDSNVVGLGATYMRIIGFTYFLTAISFAFTIAARSVGDAKLPMKASAISLGVNTVLNALLIFGLLGFPAMGVAGAALATVIARLVEMIIILSHVLKKTHPLYAKINDYFAYNLKFATKILKTSAPVIANEFLWAIGMTLYVGAYAKAGTDAYAAVQISQTVDKLFFVFAFGIGSAAAVMTGNLLGQNKREQAIQYAWYFNFLSAVSGVLLGGLLILIAPIISNFFNVSEAVRLDATKVMMVVGFFMAFKMCNALQIIGTLRGGGDTTYALFMEIGSVYLVGVPLAFLGTMYWHLPIYWVVALVCLEEVVKSVFGFSRLISKKWANNIVDKMT